MKAKVVESTPTPELKEKSGDMNDMTDDLNKLKEDMAWINLQIDQSTPLKENSSETKNSNEQPHSAQTPSES